MYEIETNVDGTVQLRLTTEKGFVDLVFVNADQFLGMVAGQHEANARRLLWKARQNAQVPVPNQVKDRLEYLRGEIEAERISYGEISELQSLVEHIDEDDVLLLQWAGVPEPGDDIVDTGL